MKRRLIIYYLAVACISLLINEACIKDGPAKGDIGDIQFVNNSAQVVSVFFANNLPDTSITNLGDCGCRFVQANSKGSCSALRGWKSHIQSMCPSGKIMFVVLDTDTIDKYGYSNVIGNYRVEKRYELSIDSLEKLNWTIVYPN